MNGMICPGYISNSTYDKCIGDVLITSPEFGYMCLVFIIVVFGCIWTYACLKDNDAKGRKHDE